MYSVALLRKQCISQTINTFTAVGHYISYITKEIRYKTNQTHCNVRLDAGSERLKGKLPRVCNSAPYVYFTRERSCCLTPRGNVDTRASERFQN